MDSGGLLLRAGRERGRRGERGREGIREDMESEGKGISRNVNKDW